ncbi:MAG: glycosyltransferase family 4 protein, partial [Actinobacteria bacterium]|nr:glycosyltransferase family 4 protein [Actinomycetota bacterium]
VDVVHGTNFVVPPTAGAAAVVTVHDLTPVHYPELCDAATLAFPSLLRRAIARGAWVHTPSRFVAAEVVQHLGADAERVVAIPSGVPAVAPADAGLGQRLAGAERYLLALGTVEPRKDLPLLVRAFDAVAGSRPDVRLVLAGPDGWGADALRRAMAEAHHGDRVVRLGWVDDQSRAGLLRGAAVVTYPSRYEGFGFPPLEAMAAGVPVVATTAGALPEVLGDAATLVPVGDLDALAEALAALLDDAGLRRQHVAAGQQRVSAYRWEDTAGAMIDLYRRAAAEPS